MHLYYYIYLKNCTRLDFTQCTLDYSKHDYFVLDKDSDGIVFEYEIWAQYIMMAHYRQAFVLHAIQLHHSAVMS